MEKYTTVCEFWTLKQSKNHVMMGSIDAWFYKRLAGIRLIENTPAYEEFIIKPYVAGGLSHAKASTETIRGFVQSSWEQSSNGFKMNVEIPFNCTAMVHIPSEEHAKILDNGMKINNSSGVDFIRHEEGFNIFRVSSGKYTFSY